MDIFPSNRFKLWRAVGGCIAANQFIKDEKLMIGRLMIAGVIAAFVFNYIVSLSVLIADPSLGVLIAYLITGLPFDLLHAAGNMVIAITLGPRCTICLHAHCLQPI